MQVWPSEQKGEREEKLKPVSRSRLDRPRYVIYVVCVLVWEGGGEVLCAQTYPLAHTPFSLRRR